MPPRPPSSGATRAKQDDAPHELPALTFSPPLSAPELPGESKPGAQPAAEGLEAPASPVARDTALPPPTVVAPKLAHLRSADSPTLLHSVTPPTPIEPTPPTASSIEDYRSRSRSSASRPSTPPSSTQTREASTSTAPTTPHLAPPAPAHALGHPSSSSDRRSRSLARGERRHHRRSSSQGTTGSRSFRETLNAYAVEAPDGSRSVNQYVLGETLGRGSYATVEKAVDRETGGEYVRPGPSLSSSRSTAAN